MSGTLILVTGAIYLFVAVDQVIKGNAGMAICYFGYSFANVGLYLMCD